MASKKEKSNLTPEKLDGYKRLITGNSKIEMKGTTIPYTSYIGHMFSYFEKDSTFGLRLPEKKREEFLKKYQTTLFISYGIVKKEFVLVPDNLLMNTQELKPWFDVSFNYARSLKPK